MMNQHFVSTTMQDASLPHGLGQIAKLYLVVLAVLLKDSQDGSAPRMRLGVAATVRRCIGLRLTRLRSRAWLGSGG